MNNKKILVVDDDQDILDIISYLLIGRGYLVKTLPTRDAVIKTIKKFHHDQLLMDVMLAGMDGREICKDIKGLAKLNSLPVILISGTHNLARSLDQQGAPNDFLAKPFDISTLLEKVEQQLAA